MLTTDNSSMMIKSEKLKKLLQKCRICDAPAKYSYFGVISCESCKMFFKRHANAEQAVSKCDFINQCEISMNKRRVCTSCRLVKCFKCGMTTDKFRAPRSNQSNTKSLVKKQQEQKSERLPTLNLLQSDSSLLDRNQWILLSNLINSYNETKLLLIGQRLVDSHHISKYNNILYQSLVDELALITYETTGKYLCLNEDLRRLSSDDRSIMLRNAADHVSCMSFEFIINYCHLLKLNAFSNTLISLYGKHSVDFHHLPMKYIDPDIILIKLGLSLFAFTENTYSYNENISKELTNSILIFKLQSKYAEITWKYLIYKYGYYEAIKRFVNLISWLLALTILMSHAQTLSTHVNDVNSLVEQTELTLILDDIDQIM